MWGRLTRGEERLTALSFSVVTTSFEFRPGVQSKISFLDYIPGDHHRPTGEIIFFSPVGNFFLENRVSFQSGLLSFENRTLSTFLVVLSIQTKQKQPYQTKLFLRGLDCAWGARRGRPSLEL